MNKRGTLDQFAKNPFGAKKEQAVEPLNNVKFADIFNKNGLNSNDNKSKATNKIKSFEDGISFI